MAFPRPDPPLNPPTHGGAAALEKEFVMRLLDACLALVLTLAVFASSVTVLVEAVHFILDSRAKALKGMLDAVFERLLKDRGAKQELENNAARLEALRSNFIDELGVSNTLKQLEERYDSAGRPQRGLLAVLRSRPAAPGRVDKVSLQDAQRRLGRTELVKSFGDRKEEILHELQSSLDARYSQFEQAASEYFRIKSRNLALVVGVFLAFMVNIDAVRVFDAFLADPALTATTIERMQAELKTQPENSTPAANKPASQEATIREALEWAETSRIAGFPVGWAYFPYCTPPGAKQVDLRCLDEKGKTKSLAQRLLPIDQMAGKPFLTQVQVGWQGVFWLISAIVTGLLIGMGGPYWFELAASLGHWRDVLRRTDKETSETNKQAAKQAEAM